MSTFGSLIRGEVLRLARRETRAALSPLRKQVTLLRRKVAQQRQQIAELSRAAKRAERSPAPAGVATTPSESGVKVRFSPRWMRKHRAKLGMSREAYAKLLGVSAQSVLGWEAGRTRPRQETIDLWARLRQMRVRDIKSGLGAAGASPAPAAGTGTKRGGRRRTATRRSRTRRAASRRARRPRPATRRSRTRRPANRRARGARRAAPSKRAGKRRR